jgi:hypothetical protein
MKKTANTIMLEAGFLLGMVAISLGLWYYPWATLVALAMLLLGGFLLGNKWD